MSLCFGLISTHFQCIQWRDQDFKNVHSVNDHAISQTILTVPFLIATEKCCETKFFCVLGFGQPFFYSTIVYKVGLWEDDIKFRCVMAQVFNY